MIKIILDIIEIIAYVIVIITFLIPIYTILKKLKNSYFKEIKDEEIEELKKRMNVNVKIYETNLFNFNGLSLYKIILISSDFVKEGKDYLKGVIAHELGHTKKKHILKSIPLVICLLLLFYINFPIYLKAIGFIVFPFIYFRIAQRFQKEADRIAYEYLGEDAIKTLLFFKEKFENKFQRIFSSILSFFLFFKFNSRKIIEDRISYLENIKNKEVKE